MTGKKHERDGESFIVSEGVDLDQLDLENMVQNEVQVPEILKTHFAQPPAIESIPGMVPQVQQSQERIWVEFALEIDGELVYFPGYCMEQSSSDVKVYTLGMDRATAMHLMAVMTSAENGAEVLCVQVKMILGEEERVVKFSEKQRIHNFEMLDESDTDLFVQVKLVF